MKVCPQCDEQYPEDVEFCAKDGAKLRTAEEDEDDPMIGRVLDGRFRIEERFSEGGMGAIYLARQETVGREVAIKTLRTALADSQEFTDRFMREARVTSRISHPNCVTIHDFGQTDDTLLYIVMEYLEGETLADRLDGDGLTVDEAIQVAIQVANGLEAAHEQDVVHRDLKPDNIFLLDAAGDRVFVKVLDFGISKVVDEGEENLTKTGQVFGTPEYMSPEQGRSKSLDGRSDLYSLGCILYEVLSGRPPFRADTPMAVLVSHIQEEPRPLSEIADVPDALGQLVEDLLEKDADDRPASAADVRRRLEAIRSDGKSKSKGKQKAAQSTQPGVGGQANANQREPETSDESPAGPETGQAESAPEKTGDEESPIDSQWGEQPDVEQEEGSSGMGVWLAGGLFVAFALVFVGGAVAVGWYAYDEFGGSAFAEADTGGSTTESASDQADDDQQVAAAGDQGSGESSGDWGELAQQFVGGGESGSGGENKEGDKQPTAGPDAGGMGNTEGGEQAGKRVDASAKGAAGGAGGGRPSAGADNDQNGKTSPSSGDNKGDNKGDKEGDDSESGPSGGEELAAGSDQTGDGTDNETAEKPESSGEPDNDTSQQASNQTGSGSSGSSSDREAQTTDKEDSSASDDKPPEKSEQASVEESDSNKGGADEDNTSEPSGGGSTGPSPRDYVTSIQPSASGPYCRAESIGRTLRGARGDFGRCSSAQGGVNARMVYQFMVTSGGDVLNMENFSTGMNQSVASCILEQTKKLSFGRQSGGNCTVRVTLQLRPP